MAGPLDKARAEQLTLAEYLAKRKQEQQGLAPGQEESEEEHWKQANAGQPAPKAPLANGFAKTKGMLDKPSPALRDLTPEDEKINIHPDDKELHESIMKEHEMSPALARDVLETYQDPEANKEELEGRFQEDMHDTGYTDEEKAKIKGYYDKNIGQ